MLNRLTFFKILYNLFCEGGWYIPSLTPRWSVSISMLVYNSWEEPYYNNNTAKVQYSNKWIDIPPHFNIYLYTNYKAQIIKYVLVYGRMNRCSSKPFSAI